MKKVFKRSFILSIMVTVLMMTTNVFATTIGEELVQPETEWQRYDEKDENILKVGNWVLSSKGVYTNSPDCIIKFKFIGTKLRIIASKSNIDGDKIPVSIDGVQEHYDISYGTGSKYAGIHERLVYEKTGLPYGIHTVIIGVQDGKYSNLRAIDIDNTGKLIPFDYIEPSRLSVLLEVDETVQLSVTSNLEDNKKLTWTSTNNEVATVDGNGQVKALKEGLTQIYAQNEDGTFKEYINVKVVPKGKAEELRLAVNLKAGETKKLYLNDDVKNITWSSADETIATVSSEGKLTAISKGLVIINAKYKDQTHLIYVRVS